MEVKRSHTVFGMSADVLPDSYVEREKLDGIVGSFITRDKVHVALRGASKSGKSWLRKKLLTDPIVVQCGFSTQLEDIYIEALSHLGVQLTVERVDKESLKGTVKASSTIGAKLVAAFTGEVAVESTNGADAKTKDVGKDTNDLQFVASLIRNSGRRLVIEDFHYLSIPVRKVFASHLKRMWEYGVNVVLVGVWATDNLLLTLNPDLSGRLEEVKVEWDRGDLERILEQGGVALNVRFIEPLLSKLVDASFENAGVLQCLTLRILDLAQIQETQASLVTLDDPSLVEVAARAYADQLAPLYLGFARRVSQGIRKRQRSTAIYAHAMRAIMNEPDEVLRNGISATAIYNEASKHQPRIQQGNLKTILDKLDLLQVDDEGRGLVITYNTATEMVTVVDRQLLLFRRYGDAKWPWDDLIASVDTAGVDDVAFEAENSEGS